MKKAEQQIGKIVRLKGDRAFVALITSGEEKQAEEIDALNSISARKGDKVTIAWRSISKKKDLLMLWAPPLLSIIAGAIFGYRMAIYLKYPPEEGLFYGILIWLFLGVVYSFRYWLYAYGRGLQPTVINILEREL